MATTTVYLVRHGETDWNVAGRLQGIEDTNLNEKGMRQAHACGVYLQNEDWDVLITSPLKRAKQTAITINNYLKKEEVLEIVDLKEKDFGEGSGKTREEISLAFPDGVIMGMEDDTTFSKRVMIALEQIIDQHATKKVLVVAHGAVINAMLSVISDGELGYGKSHIDNGGITQLIHDGEIWTVGYHNDVKHLTNN
jgi:uncharacterized phosphatase